MKSFKQFLMEMPPAWHGTPHIVDAFSLDNVGTGEGADSFGWGLYFTSSKEVAEWYSGDLGLGGSPVPSFYEINGVRTKSGTAEQKAADLIFSAGLSKARNLAKSMYSDAKNDEEWTRDKGLQYYEDIYNIVISIRTKSQVKKTKGNVYHVDIMADDDTFLNWDASLEHQTDYVKERLQSDPITMDTYRFIQSVKGKVGDNGRMIYMDVVDKMKTKKAASQFLFSIGISGIKYLDEYSRNVGHGTCNYVVFSDTIVKITGRK